MYRQRQREGKIDGKTDGGTEGGRTNAVAEGRTERWKGRKDKKWCKDIRRMGEQKVGWEGRSRKKKHWNSKLREERRVSPVPGRPCPTVLCCQQGGALCLMCCSAMTWEGTVLQEAAQNHWT